jgi:uncharacterized protein YjcR
MTNLFSTIFQVGVMTTATTSAKKRGGQPGNKNALKHGFYSEGFKPDEVDDLSALEGVDLSDEIKMLRVIMRRMFEQIGAEKSITDWAEALNALGAASTRLAGLLRTQKLIAGSGSEVTDALSQALREVTSEISKS